MKVCKVSEDININLIKEILCELDKRKRERKNEGLKKVREKILESLRPEYPYKLHFQSPEGKLHELLICGDSQNLRGKILAKLYRRRYNWHVSKMEYGGIEEKRRFPYGGTQP